MHRRADIARAAETLGAAGFDNISMDLIVGLPHQTRESWEQSVSELLDLRPEHISIYMLEVDEGSHLGKESLAGGTRYSAPAIPPDDTQAEFYDSACKRLATAGYDHYEISNWALPDCRSRHNLKYWQREPYLGLGAGAHSFDGKTRWANAHDSAQYVAMIEQGITATRANRASHFRASPRRRIFPRPSPTRRNRSRANRTHLRRQRQRRQRALGQNLRANRFALFARFAATRIRPTPSRLRPPHHLKFDSFGTPHMIYVEAH